MDKLCHVLYIFSITSTFCFQWRLCLPLSFLLRLYLSQLLDCLRLNAVIGMFHLAMSYRSEYIDSELQTPTHRSRRLSAWDRAFDQPAGRNLCLTSRPRGPSHLLRCLSLTSEVSLSLLCLVSVCFPTFAFRHPIFSSSHLGPHLRQCSENLKEAPR